MEIALGLTLATTCVCFIGIWLINVMTQDAGVIDYYWGPGFVVIGGINFYLMGTGSVFEWVLIGIVTVWAARLATHLISRHHAKYGEDGRYREMRQAGGRNFWWKSLFSVFLLQAIILWLIAAPLHVAFGTGFTTVVPLFWLGVGIFAIGFVIEVIADHQLTSGKIAGGHTLHAKTLVAGGLWRRSRHPNYFGEIVLWWGIAVSAFALSGSVICFAGPALLTVVMIKITIPLTEKYMETSRSGYSAYKQSTPMLVPFKPATAKT